MFFTFQVRAAEVKTSLADIMSSLFELPSTQTPVPTASPPPLQPAVDPSAAEHKAPGMDPAEVTRSYSVIRGADTIVTAADSRWFNPTTIKAKARYNFLAQLASIDVMKQTPHSVEQIRKTSIICTIGPKTNTPEAIAALRCAGMNIMRLNFSHGTYSYHLSVIENLRKSYDLWEGPQVAIALDTKGPEIRSGRTVNDADVILEAGQEVTITTDVAFKEACDSKTIYVDYPNIGKVVSVGSLIFIDDGLLKLSVKSISEDKTSLVATVSNRATLSSTKGVNLPGAHVDLPAVSAKDREDLEWGVKHGIDFIFASFIRNADGVREIRSLLGEAGSRVQIISKIENQQGIDNFNEILMETDGVMVARGDLGIEIPVEKVFLAQKMIIARCNIMGKPVICATQMLESMTTNPRPTRAEVSDVANAVMDGADCVMLSGETAKGKYPNETVSMMHIVCKEAESAVSNIQHYRAIQDIHPEMFQASETLAGSAVNAAFSRNIKAILVFSISGRTARLVAKYRPSCPIVCVTTDPITARQSCISRGVYPVLVEETFEPNKETWLDYIERQLQHAVHVCKHGNIKMLKKEDLCVVVQGWAGGRGHSNTMRLVTV